jgi:ribosome-binding factor A
MTADGRRPRRVAEGIRAVLSLRMAQELTDPRLMGVVVTKVEVPPDISVAHIKVRLLQDDADAKTRVRTVQSLRRAASRLRRAIGPELQLKRVPELRFEYDTAPDDRARVETLLKEIAEEDQQRASDDSLEEH